MGTKCEYSPRPYYLGQPVSEHSTILRLYTGTAVWVPSVKIAQATTILGSLCLHKDPFLPGVPKAPRAPSLNSALITKKEISYLQPAMCDFDYYFLYRKIPVTNPGLTTHARDKPYCRQRHSRKRHKICWLLFYLSTLSKNHHPIKYTLLTPFPGRRPTSFQNSNLCQS